jgi:tetratricopeptide (TPR) repeat protein
VIVEERTKNERVFVSSKQKAAIGAVLLFTSYLLFLTFRYWNADRLYASGVGYNSIGKPDVATKYLTQAISLEPNQAIYYGGSSSQRGLAYSYASLALAFNQQKQTDQTTQFSNMALTAIDKAIALSPANVNLKRTRFGIFVMLSAINPNYLIDAKNTLEAAILQAPTDAKLYYNLGLVYARIGQVDKAVEILKKTIDLKSDYKDARLAYAYLLIDKKQNAEAKAQLEYILTNIDPTDSLSKQALESIK